MEDTHGVGFADGTKALLSVLILIIMEDTHGVVKKVIWPTIKGRLNPYYNGRYSWRLMETN